MKKSRRSPEQIIEILRQIEAGKAAGKPVAQLCKEAGVGEWTYYRWRKQYQGIVERRGSFELRRRPDLRFDAVKRHDPLRRVSAWPSCRRVMS